jgi:UDP-N-acetylglucosamine 2-epimerase (non-hydrolysing)
MLDQVLQIFGIVPDHDLDLMRVDQSPTQVASRILTSLEPMLQEEKPDWIVVQGDTTTVAAASLAAFYTGVKVAHVEAGLRTGDKRIPFPEEMNRVIADALADLHLAPTEQAKQNLLNEGFPEKTIVVTGNTAIDALLWVRDRTRRQAPELPDGLRQILANRQLLLVTSHRRESFGEGFESICHALLELTRRHTDLCIIYPVHLNPNVQEPVRRILGKAERVYLLDPLPYAPFVWLMDQAYLILTDSGGVQEEAPSLGKPVLVMREKTERPEGIAAGYARLVGTSTEGIVSSVCELLAKPNMREKMVASQNPYGDGRAAVRIVDTLLR